MTIPYTEWNETIPEGSESISLGDERIRELKLQLRDLISVEHYMPTSSGQDIMWGYHNKITLLEGSAQSAIADAVVFYTKEVSSKSELHCKNEDGVEFQLTSKGSFIAGLSKEIRMWSGLVENIPATWALCDGGGSPVRPNLVGKFLLGANGTEAGSTGGSDSVAISEAQTPWHAHTVSGDGGHTHNIIYQSTAGSVSTVNIVASYSLTTYNSGYANGTGSGHTHTLNNSGSGTAYNNRPAYVELAFICKG